MTHPLGPEGQPEPAFDFEVLRDIGTFDALEVGDEVFALVGNGMPETDEPFIWEGDIDGSEGSVMAAVQRESVVVRYVADIDDESAEPMDESRASLVKKVRFELSQAVLPEDYKSELATIKLLAVHNLRIEFAKHKEEVIRWKNKGIDISNFPPPEACRVLVDDLQKLLDPEKSELPISLVYTYEYDAMEQSMRTEQSVRVRELSKPCLIVVGFACTEDAVPLRLKLDDLDRLDIIVDKLPIDNEASEIIARLRKGEAL